MTLYKQNKPIQTKKKKKKQKHQFQQLLLRTLIDTFSIFYRWIVMSWQLMTILSNFRDQLYPVQCFSANTFWIHMTSTFV